MPCTTRELIPPPQKLKMLRWRHEVCGKEKGKTNVTIYITFTLVYFREVGRESCWNQLIVKGVMYIVGGQVPTQIQKSMMSKIVGK
jgi:hypothetical protein